MKVGIAGLGLIGASMAKAYQGQGHTVLGFDIDKTVLGYLQLSEVIGGELTADNARECDLLLVALYPQATVEYLTAIAPHLSPSALVIDLCGVKENVCRAGFDLAKEYGFTFVGGHPMAGSQYSGAKYSRANLFSGAPMVLVPPRYDDMELLQRVKDMLKPAGFGRLTVTTAEEHDKMIAFTSQLAHVVSNAYVKSPTAQQHKGFSAGSYKDLTRVAWLNERMWTELFLENREPLLFELETIIASLQAYRDALQDKDAERLCALLRDGRLAKERVDG